MSKHTPEPWVFPHDLSNTSEANAIRSGNVIITKLAAYEFYGPSVEEANANAARIVACVNALEGIDDVQSWVNDKRKQYHEHLVTRQQLAETRKALIKLEYDVRNGNPCDEALELAHQITRRLS